MDFSMRLKVMEIIAPLLFLVHQRNPWNLQGYAAHPLVWQFSSPQKIPVVPKQLQNNWKRPEARQIATSYTGLLSKLASHYKPAVFCAAALRLRDRNFEQGRPSGVHCFHQAHLRHLFLGNMQGFLHASQDIFFFYDL